MAHMSLSSVEQMFGFWAVQLNLQLAGLALRCFGLMHRSAWFRL